MLPLLQEPYPEVHLPNAPLDLVLCQVRFPDTSSLALQETAERVKSYLGDVYPVIRQETEQGVNVHHSKTGLQVDAKQSVVWRLETVHKDWFLTLNHRFAALSTRSYTSRRDFIDRLRGALSALTEIANPTVCDRIGIRYIDRVVDRQIIDNLHNYVSIPFSGVLEMPTTENVAAEHSFSDILLHLDKTARLRIRCGVMPPHSKPDPSLESYSSPTWVLDLDAFDDAPYEFTPDLADRAEELAGAAYQMFRWTVSDEFINYFGGSAECGS